MQEFKIKIDYKNPDENGNLAEKLDDDQRTFLGNHLLDLVKNDILSRQPWMDMNNMWLKLAAQVAEHKSYPWPDASNVKYPIVTLAAIQFHARSLPNLVNSGSPVKVGVLGEDEGGEKRKRAKRIATHMNYQLMREQQNWLDDTDRLLYILPISGQAHRKVYFSGTLGRAATKLLTPNELIVNYHAKNLENARITEKLELTSNEVREFENSEMILSVTQEEPSGETEEKSSQEVKDEISGQQEAAKQDVPYTFYEIHWLFDLDGDGYKEPYVMTINAEDGQLLRIQARWTMESKNPKVIKRNERTNKIIRIEPDNYFIHYFFLPNPTSATHGLGFGHLLGPINEAANTAINALLDSGHLANVQGGFIAKGTRIRGGQIKFKAGYYQYVNTAGRSLSDSIMTLPIKEPSSTLFNLLGMLVSSAERIASISDMMVGESPGQNTPATTSMAVLEQGLKVFTGIYGRVHRSLSREYNRLFEVNRDYLDIEKQAILLDDGVEAEILGEDYETQNLDIAVASDPALVSDAQKLLKSQSLLEKVQLGTVSAEYATKKALEAEGYTDDEIEAAMKIEPPPNPEMIKLELEQKRIELEETAQDFTQKMDVIRIQSEARKDIAQSISLIAKAEGMEQDQKMKQMQIMFDQFNKEVEQEMQKITIAADAQLKYTQSKKVDKEGQENATSSNNGSSDGDS